MNLQMKNKSMILSIAIGKEGLIKYDYTLVTTNHSVYYVNL